MPRSKSRRSWQRSWRVRNREVMVRRIDCILAMAGHGLRFGCGPGVGFARATTSARWRGAKRNTAKRAGRYLGLLVCRGLQARRQRFQRFPHDFQQRRLPWTPSQPANRLVEAIRAARIPASLYFDGRRRRHRAALQTPSITAEIRLGTAESTNLAIVPVSLTKDRKVDFGMVRASSGWKVFPLGLVVLDIPQLTADGAGRRWKIAKMRRSPRCATLQTHSIPTVKLRETARSAFAAWPRA